MTDVHSDLQNLVVFGGASGIGLATVVEGAKRYKRVILVDVNPEAADLPIVRSGGAKFERCDASDAEAVPALLEQVRRTHGPLSSVVTTVGGAHPHDPFTIDIAAWRRELAFNLESAYVVGTAAAASMATDGGGAIVTCSSSFAALPGADRIAYSAAKAGVIAFTKSLAMAGARHGVRVNCIAPGSTDTARLRKMAGSDEAMQARRAASPQGYIATPEDLAESILYLASPAARSVTGQVVWVNNGAYMP